MSQTLSIGSDSYRLDVFPLPETTETNPMPLDIAIGGGKAWVCCEFDRRIYSVPLSATDGTIAAAIDIPNPTTPLFRTVVFGVDAASHMGMAEDIDVDPQGNVWLTQAGATIYGGVETNRSRVLKYSPTTGAWSSFLLPWNNVAATSVVVDGQRVWCAAGGPVPGGALCVTRPASWSRDITDGVAAPCPLPRSDEFAGWRVQPLDGSWPAHMAIGPDGRLYVTNYWSASVTAYDRATLGAQTYALPSGSSGPWQIAFDGGGACWVACDATRQIAKLIPSSGAWFVYNLGLATEEHVHSIALDNGSWWFTAYSATTGGRIGRRKSDGTIDLTSPLDILGFPKGAAGIANESGRIWVALFGSKAVGRLTKL